MAPFNARIFAASLCASLLAGCPAKEEETGGASESSTGGASDTSTGGTEDSTANPTETGDTGSDTSAAESTAAESTTVEPTTGEPTGEPAGLCEAHAQWSLMCDLAEGSSEAELVMRCEEERELEAVIYGPACGARFDALSVCEAAGPCETDCLDEEEAAFNCLPEAGDVCKAFAATLLTCSPEEDEVELAGQCQLNVHFGSFAAPACGAAFEALAACQAQLSCEDIAIGEQCMAEGDALTRACPDENGQPAQPNRPRFVDR